MASGTGATAAAYIAHTIGDVPMPVAVSLPGGTISVWFNEEGAWMDGPAEYSFSGSVD
jgi:diaminopimelate epimerase